MGLQESDNLSSEPLEQVDNRQLPDRSVPVPSTTDAHSRILPQLSFEDRLEIEKDSDYRSLCQSVSEMDDEERTQTVDSRSAMNAEQVGYRRQTGSCKGSVVGSRHEARRNSGSPQLLFNPSADGENRADAVDFHDLNEQEVFPEIGEHSAGYTSKYV